MKKFFAINFFLLTLFAQAQVQKILVLRFGELNRPRGISISPAGEIYVADTGNNSVKKFTVDGKLIFDVTGYGWGELEFDQPYDVDAESGIAIYVADYNNHRIQRFDKNLNFVASLGNEIAGEKIFGFPRSVAVSKFGELFILDGENFRCVKINKFNRVEKVFGGIEAGSGRLINPAQISISPQNQIVVLDEGRILIFDYYGNFLKKFDLPGSKEATGLYADSLIFVASGNNVLAFNYDGLLIYSLSFEETIFDIAYKNPYLYCLTTNQVMVYKLNFAENEKN
ncbi:NHL repeat-containing protein [Candidatus Chrysopegis kryptomonas]|uniref:NHL repeat-containing protein n=1 Tax=Candidatus Chryseopegocella kryptomonas TaxID=1633643 RepID=A0A0P1ML88_9BACT|nr:NHL repeat-containing protein [Candidatus Chrysopegis kryptomonas]CUS96478.1 NHL repeat-containing protein [Candidatus Chrysopegis kryptomonas]